MNKNQFDRLLNELGGENTNRAVHAAPLRDKLQSILTRYLSGEGFLPFQEGRDGNFY